MINNYVKCCLDKCIAFLQDDYRPGGNNREGEQMNEQPTAFDVDKVTEWLEDYLFEKYCIEGDPEIAEIVKGGGVE